jgi:hypothetical protein
MTERLFKRDLPLLQAAGIRARHGFGPGPLRGLERVLKTETKNESIEHKQFPFLSNEQSARQKGSSHSFSREHSLNDYRNNDLRREKTFTNYSSFQESTLF